MTIWQRTKLAFVTWLDRTDKYCWAALVEWAYRHRYPFDGMLRGDRQDYCSLSECLANECAEEEGPCWCGKFMPDDMDGVPPRSIGDALGAEK